MILGAPISDRLKSFLSRPPELELPHIENLGGAIASESISYSRSPFEHQALAWAVSQDLFRKYGAAFWRMGIGSGKTFTAINLYRQLRSETRFCVIICPKALIGTWAAQIAEHCTETHAVYAYDAIRAKTKRDASVFSDVVRKNCAVFFVFNVEAFSAPNKELTYRWNECMKAGALVILDESSTIKTPYQPRAGKGLRCGHLSKMARDAKYRIAMTGTEVTKSPLDVFQQAEFLVPGFWGESFFMFKKRYAVLVQEYGAGGRTHDKIVGYQHVDELMAKLDTISYCVRTSDVIDLPERTDEIIPVELGSKTRKLYDELKKELVTELESGAVLSTPSKIAAFTKLRQITGGFVLDGEGQATATGETDKLDALEALVSDTDEQIVIFANHRAEIAAIEKRLAPLGQVVTYCGDGGDHKKAVEDFTDGKARFFVAHPASGGYGLNLQVAHVMIFYSIITRDFEQVIGRIRRSGQRHPCLYYYLVARDTVDERLLEIVRTDSEMLRLFHAGDSEMLIRLLTKPV